MKKCQQILQDNIIAVDGSDTRQIALIEKDTVVHNNLDQNKSS